MPQLKLFAHPLTGGPDKVLITLAEGGFTDYEYVTIDLLTREHKVCATHTTDLQAPNNELTQERLQMV